MYHTTYLIHYNKNHSKANGQFVSGDGDGDGIVNDHAHRKNELREKTRNIVKKYKTPTTIGAVAQLAGGTASIAGGVLGLIGETKRSKKLETAGFITAMSGITVSIAGGIVTASTNKKVDTAAKELIKQYGYKNAKEVFEQEGIAKKY